jgi:hypothetical protein
LLVVGVGEALQGDIPPDDPVEDPFLVALGKVRVDDVTNLRDCLSPPGGKRLNVIVGCCRRDQDGSLADSEVPQNLLH